MTQSSGEVNTSSVNLAARQHVYGAGRFPTKGRQPAVDTYVSASLNTRQTPEMFGGISTD